MICFFNPVQRTSQHFEWKSSLLECFSAGLSINFVFSTQLDGSPALLKLSHVSFFKNKHRIKIVLAHTSMQSTEGHTPFQG